VSYSDVLVENSKGGFSYLTGIAPYSCGIATSPTHRLIRVVLARPLPWRAGIEGALQLLERRQCPPESLAGVELRSPMVRTMAEFGEFNDDYIQTMRALGVIGDGPNPVARTNVVPVRPIANVTVLHAVTISVPANGDAHRPSFVVAGAGELREARLDESAIVRCGDSSPTALAEKARFVLGVMQDRITGLGAAWSHVTCASVYTRHAMGVVIDQVVRAATGDRFGVTWYDAAPPVMDIEFEMDARGGTDEIVTDLAD
jgi:hypothetical protein